MAFKRGCNHCDRGQIFLDAPHSNGNLYRPYLACDCEAGGLVAAHMERLWELMNRNGADAFDGPTRYSVRFGSLRGVRRGVPEEQPEPVPAGVEGDVPDWVTR